MSLTGWAGTFGAPVDAVAWTALALAVALASLGAKLSRRLFRAPARPVLGLLAGGAALLSWGYVEHYLRGGPRIIDATTYWLEARRFAEGHIGWIAADPTASARGRFLVATIADDTTHLAPLFPPGWPAVLSLGFLVGHPMLVGPCIAALLVLATHELARAVTSRDDVARLAALFSAACAALRYHTADTMSHGLAALLVATGLAASFAIANRDRDGSPTWKYAALAGLAVGALVATRPVSGLVLAVVVGAVTYRGARRSFAPMALAAAVPIALFLLEQRAVTGSFGTSSQTLYYALADGPPGCFRYGFGAGIGCLHEHGDFVRARLADGFGPAAALLTTLRRLEMHLLDVANAEPLALLVPLGALLGRPRRRASLLGLAVVAQILAYAPFYFDGNYPGGGARFYADILPVEHVLVALALAALVERARADSFDLARVASPALAIAFAGFALHAGYEHRALADRDGGRPFFEPSLLEASEIDRGLLFLDTDHGYNLAFDPSVTDPAGGIVVARALGDHRDRLTWERLGRPPTYRYRFDASGVRPPSVTPFHPEPAPDPWRFEAEVEWPAIAQHGGFFEPTFATGTCASAGAVLAMHPAPGETMTGTVTVPVPHAGRWRLTVHVAASAPALARFAVVPHAGSPPLTSFTYASTSRQLECARLESPELSLDAGHFDLFAQANAEGIALDAFELSPVSARSSGLGR